MKFSDALTAAMKLRGMGAKDLATLSGVSVGMISMLKSGKRPTPSFELVIALARALGVPLEFLAGTPSAIHACENMKLQDGGSSTPEAEVAHTRATIRETADQLRMIADRLNSELDTRAASVAQAAVDTALATAVPDKIQSYRSHGSKTRRRASGSQGPKPEPSA